MALVKQIIPIRFLSGRSNFPLLFLLAALVCGGCIQSISADTHTADPLPLAKQQLLLKAQDCLFNDDFEASHQHLDSLIVLYPEDPAGYLFKACVLLGQMTAAEENLYPDSFRYLIDTSLFLAEAGLKMTNPISPTEAAWFHLCEGHAKAYRSLWEARFGSYANTLKFAFDARSAYEAGLKQDSTLYDLYGGIGLYHYWKSAKAGLLRWVRIFKNDKQKGIEELYLTCDSSLISSTAARNALIYIWLDKKEYDSVIVIANEMRTLYPMGLSPLWPMATAYFEKKDYQNALNIYLKLRERLATSPGNYYNLIEVDYQLYRCYDKLKQKEQAKATAIAFNSYYPQISKKIRWDQRSKVAFLRRAAER